MKYAIIHKWGHYNSQDKNFKHKMYEVQFKAYESEIKKPMKYIKNSLKYTFLKINYSLTMSCNIILTHFCEYKYNLK